MNNYYTRKGDDGLTTWLGKGRITKYDLRFEALGSLDETSASLGLARSLTIRPEDQRYPSTHSTRFERNDGRSCR